MHDTTLRQQWEQLNARVSAVQAENTRLRDSQLQFQQQNAQLQEDNTRLRTENQLLRQKLDQYIRHYFGGQRNEGLDRQQMELLLQGLPKVVVLEKEQPKAAAPQRANGESHPVRRVLEESKLATVEVVLEPDEVKVAPQGWVKLSEERTTLLDWEPGKFLRRVIIRPRYVKNECFALAPLPPLPIPQGMVGPGLLAEIVVSKYEHHQPLYRQARIFEQQHGVDLSRKTMGFWVEQAAELLKPIYRAMLQALVQGDYLQVDETPIQYLDPDVKGKSRRGWFWAYSRPDSDVAFTWALTRGAQQPRQLLEKFQGKLQTDGYVVYESLVNQRQEIVLVGCWAHARRNFVEAVAETKLAAWFVLQIGLLYRVEKQLREHGAGPDLRAAVRVWQSQPVLQRLKAAMELMRRRALPQGKLGQALEYALTRWESLTRFAEDGKLEIDNNLVENAIRPSALGKKNWLFIGHPDAGERSAVIYSVLGSCRRQGINPFDYLKDLFTRLPAAKITEIEKFTPAAWAKARSKPPPAQLAA